MLEELREEIRDLQARLDHLCRVGQVVRVNAAEHTAVVRLPDADDMITKELPVLVRFAQDNQAYHLPDEGEQVLCLFLPNGLEEGFVLAGFYSAICPPPINNRQRWYRKFPDGTELYYDRAEHHLRAQVKGSARIKAEDGLEIEAGTLVKGDLYVEGGVYSTGDVIAAGQILDSAGNTNHHNH